MNERPILLGMNNPVSPLNPRHALFPHPPGCTGHRVWRLLQTRLPHVTRKMYLDAFDRRNLVMSAVWSSLEGREGVVRFWESLDSRRAYTCLILGRQTLRALGLEGGMDIVHPLHHNNVTLRYLPHPSGRNLWYNNQVNRDLAALVLEELYCDARSAQLQRL